MSNQPQSLSEKEGHSQKGIDERCIEALLAKDRLNHLGGFIQGLIHNINGPLHNMSMLVEVLVRSQGKLEKSAKESGLSVDPALDALLQKQGRRLEQLSQQIKTLTDMLRSFMLLHEIERNESEVDVNLVLTKLAETFRSDLFFKHQVTLELRLTKNLPLVRVLGRHLLPALVHLFKNAVTAMRQSPEKRLVLESALEEDGIRIAFRDTGCGIASEEARRRCFDLFYSHWAQLPEIPSTDECYLGFGLFAVRRLLEPYGVRVALESVDGETTALLHIPFSCSR
ncbi:MAG: HAMP domain-containing histidine kinase [Deltaproteobacteria bacterium]|nr:HAMP domain-containing histidine kinase [Deltaproteobacteria bacterium]